VEVEEEMEMKLWANHYDELQGMNNILPTIIYRNLWLEGDMSQNMNIR
jgi:hypothetical protein